MKKFNERVYEIVEAIPLGKVTTYGQIARMLGNPRVARQVGWAMRNCPEDLPWQRVVMADGSVTGGAYSEIRTALLEEENVPFLSDGKVDMKTCFWMG
ncbi:MAG: methylated-DNA--[protein]-cysteine S-methyltransferase [Clostridiales bacterium]|jgi:methylated-DNA-protein-cysteine methyltransferase-like protein|nr:methylated-DNA--[protein]-cysteine S-methyltransferase [Clostridiales bacterium]